LKVTDFLTLIVGGVGIGVALVNQKTATQRADVHRILEDIRGTPEVISNRGVAGESKAQSGASAVQQGNN
jgi:hypothetical protein